MALALRRQHSLWAFSSRRQCQGALLHFQRGLALRRQHSLCPAQQSSRWCCTFSRRKSRGSFYPCRARSEPILLQVPASLAGRPVKRTFKKRMASSRASESQGAVLVDQNQDEQRESCAKLSARISSSNSGRLFPVSTDERYAQSGSQRVCL